MAAFRQGFRGFCSFAAHSHTLTSYLQDPKTRQEVQDLVAREAWAELERRMQPRISFGTAGLGVLWTCAGN